MNPAMPANERGKWSSLALAAGVHIALGMFLFYGVRWQNRLPDAVEVELVSAPPPAAQLAPPPPPAPKKVKSTPPSTSPPKKIAPPKSMIAAPEKDEQLTPALLRALLQEHTEEVRATVASMTQQPQAAPAATAVAYTRELGRWYTAYVGGYFTEQAAAWAAGSLRSSTTSAVEKRDRHGCGHDVRRVPSVGSRRR